MRKRCPSPLLVAPVLLAGLAALVLVPPGFAEPGAGAGGASQKLGLRTAALDQVYFSNYSPAFGLARPGAEASFYGTAVGFEEDGRDIVAVVEGKKTRFRGKGGRLKLGKRAVLFAKAVLPPPFAGEGKTELTEAWVWAPAEASVLRLGQVNLLCLDLDFDGKYWEPREDGIVYPGSSWVVPLDASFTVGNATWTIERAEDEALFASSREDRGIDGNAGELQALRAWNEYRVEAGLPAARLDEALCADAVQHARYLEQNPGDGHEEYPGKPGFTEAGKASGTRSCIGFIEDAPLAVVDMLTELYHKRPLLEPATVRVGVVARHGHTLLDGMGGREPRGAGWPEVRWPLAFPAHEQTIQDRQYVRELPASLPIGTPAGSSILLMFRELTPGISKVEAKLSRFERSAWVPVEVYFSSPEQPANPERPSNDGCVALYPKKVLPGGTTLRVQIAWTDRAGARQGRDWLFHTK